MDRTSITNWVFFLLGILALLNLLDYITTAMILDAGGEEVNPIMNFIYQKYGIEYILYFKALCIGFLLFAFLRYPYTRTDLMVWVLSILNIGYATLGIHNVLIVMILL